MRHGKRRLKQPSQVDLTPTTGYAGRGAASLLVVLDTHTLSESCPFSSPNFNRTVYTTTIWVRFFVSRHSCIIPDMETQALLNSRRAEILTVAARHGARNVRIFGSVARGDARQDSDVDLLVDLEPGRSLFDLGGLLIDLQTLLGVEVDVVTEKGLRPRIRSEVLREAVPL